MTPSNIVLAPRKPARQRVRPVAEPLGGLEHPLPCVGSAIGTDVMVSLSTRDTVDWDTPDDVGDVLHRDRPRTVVAVDFGRHGDASCSSAERGPN